MGIAWDDVVLIEHGSKPGDPTVITINCPDKAGLGFDLCRIVLEFGLYVTRGDFATDGKWCYIVSWVVRRPSSLKVDWERLKNRLMSTCPSCMISFYLNQQSTVSPLKVFCLDRKELLHDVTKVLCELELTIQRVKVMTTPDDKVLDLFFITDSMCLFDFEPRVFRKQPLYLHVIKARLRTLYPPQTPQSGNHGDLLHTKQRRDETCEHLSDVLGEYCISCELQLAGPECEVQQGFSSLPQEVAEELFSCELSKEVVPKSSSSDTTKLRNATITVDNLLSPAHTLFQIQCVDQKGLVYDILRTSKDCDIQIAFGRILSTAKGYRTIDLFIQTTDGKKILDDETQASLCSRLKEEMVHPLRVTVASRGPDTELLVANPVELSGKGRPRVFYDVTFALKKLGICVFSAEIGRHSTAERQWEVYRFRLDESPGHPLASRQA